MPKKRKQPRKQRKPPRQNGASSTPRAERAVDSLMTVFVAWTRERQPEADVAAYEDVARTATHMKQEQLGHPGPTGWDAELLDTVVGKLMPAKVLADENYAAAIVPAMRAYLTFLKETGQWADDESTRREALRTLDQLEPTMVRRFTDMNNKSMGARVLALAAQEDVDVDDEEQLAAFIHRFNSMPQEWREQATDGPRLAVGEPPKSGLLFDVLVNPEEQEAEALLELPITGQVTALLEWVGTSREITGTGALRLKDIPDVAERLGVELPEAAIQSMWQLDDLSELWVAAIETGIIEQTATTVRPGSQAEAWRRRLPTDMVEIGRALVGNMVLFSVSVSQEGRYPPWLATQLTGVLAMLLATAASGESGNLAELEAGVRENTTPAGLAGELVFGLAERWLDHLAATGIVELTGSDVVVPPSIRASLIEPMRILGLDVHPVNSAGADAAWQPSPLLSAEGHSGGESAQVDATHQIKVQLQGSRPPIWRRLRLPGSTPLDELHEILQTAFGWTNNHLHRFTTGEPYRSAVSYEPSRQERFDLGLGGGPSVVDEATVTLAGLAPRPRDRLTYLYDFDDDWTHSITVESIDEPNPGEVLPRCTGGRRMAPFDDSGGVLGWEMMVAAALDETDEDHRDVRDWLGLETGERFDPAEFDAARVTGALQEL